MVIAGLEKGDFLRSYGEMIRDESFDCYGTSLKYSFEYDSSLGAVSCEERTWIRGQDIFRAVLAYQAHHPRPLVRPI